MHPLIAHFQQYLPLTAEEQAMISSRATRWKIKRRQMILQEGFTCGHYTFVVQGCFRMYFTKASPYPPPESPLPRRKA